MPEPSMCGRAIDGRSFGDCAEALRSPDPGLRREAARILTQLAVPPSQSAPILLGALTDADAEVRSRVRDFFLQLAAEICRLRNQEGELKEELTKTKAVLEAQMLTVLEHEKKQALGARELEQSNRELEAFMYSVSHDLRAPLRVIKGLALVLLEDFGQTPSDQLLDHVKHIKDCAERMSESIDDLLTLARVGRSQLEPTSVRFRELVDQVRSDLSSRASGRKVLWDIGDLPEVLADAKLLRVVVENLLSNALKFTMKRGEAVIEVRATKNSSGSIICVRDNGAGFDRGCAGLLFQPFSRLHSSSEYEGRGMGLAVVKRIVARHGGETWAEGEVDRGAAFYFSLPEKPQTF